MYKRFIALLGVFLSSYVPAAAQTPAPQIVLVQARVAPALMTHRTVSTPLLTASVQYENPRKSAPHFRHLFAGVYETDGGMQRLPTEEVKTLFFTRSSLPLVQLLSGRLQLDAFQNTLHLQNLLQPYPGSPRPVHLSGLSLTFHFGRDARTRRPIQAWRCLSRIVGAVLN